MILVKCDRAIRLDKVQQPPTEEYNIFITYKKPKERKSIVSTKQPLVHAVEVGV